MKVGGQLYPRERDTLPSVQESGWVSGPVWLGPKIYAPTGVRIPDSVVCSESLQRLRYVVSG